METECDLYSGNKNGDYQGKGGTECVGGEQHLLEFSVGGGNSGNTCDVEGEEI